MPEEYVKPYKDVLYERMVEERYKQRLDNESDEEYRQRQDDLEEIDRIERINEAKREIQQRPFIPLMEELKKHISSEFEKLRSTIWAITIIAAIILTIRAYSGH